MLEAYEAFGNMQSMMDLTEGSDHDRRARSAGTLDIEYQGTSVSLASPWRRATMAELTSDAAGVPVSVHAPVDELRALCEQHDIPVEPGWGSGQATQRAVREARRTHLGRADIRDHVSRRDISACTSQR